MLKSLYWIGANYQHPVELPDTKGLCWRKAVVRCLESVYPWSIPQHDAEPSPPSPSAIQISPEPLTDRECPPAVSEQPVTTAPTTPPEPMPQCESDQGYEPATTMAEVILVELDMEDWLIEWETEVVLSTLPTHKLSLPLVPSLSLSLVLPGSSSSPSSVLTTTESSQVTIIYIALLQCRLCQSSFTVLNMEIVCHSPLARQNQQFNSRLQQSQTVQRTHLAPVVLSWWSSRWQGLQRGSVSGAHLVVLDFADVQGCRGCL